MSKGNHFLGTAMGKVGDAVFYRANGEQRTRLLVTPTNPRTDAQMRQRVKMANIPAIYRAAKAVLKDSFEVRKAGESSYNAFSRAALNVAPYLTKQMVQNCLALPMKVQASRGSLPTIPWPNDGELIGYPRVILDGINADEATVGEFTAAFLAAYPQYKNGDTITFVEVYFVENEDLDIEDAYNAVSVNQSIILDETSEVTLASLGFKSVLTIQGSVEPSWGGSADAAAATTAKMGMRAIIMSRRDEGGKLLVSSQYFGLTNAASALWVKYRSVSALNEAIASYGSGDATALANS